MAIKTIKELNDKIWYRVLKVIYILSYIISIVVIQFLIYDEIIGFNSKEFENYSEWMWLALSWLIVNIIFFEIIRIIFYYILFGKINPQKK